MCELWRPTTLWASTVCCRFFIKLLDYLADWLTVSLYHCLTRQSYLTTDGQSASLSWCQATIRTRDQFFFLLEIFFRQLRACYFVAPSLTRGRVCNLVLLQGLDSAVPLWCESHGTQDRILLSQFLRLLQPGRPGPRIYIPQEQGGPVIAPGTEFPFCRLLRQQSYGERILVPYWLTNQRTLSSWSRSWQSLT
jgi:hypothetical protein